jgi:hypothetical protein
MVSDEEEAEVVVVGMGLPMGTLLVYDRRRGIAVGLEGLELSTSVDVEQPEYSGLG